MHATLTHAGHEIYFVIAIDYHDCLYHLVVNLYPADRFISYISGPAQFTCQPFFSRNTLVSVQWLVNGTRIENLVLNQTGTNVETRFSDHLEVGRLTFTNLQANLNNSRIQCQSTYHSGTTETSSGTTMILLQGK